MSQNITKITENENNNEKWINNLTQTQIPANVTDIITIGRNQSL